MTTSILDIARHPDPFGSRWRAKWIWSERPEISVQTATRPVLADASDRVALFRRCIELEAVPASVPARIWADGRYILTVNGHELARGPVRADPRRAHYDVVDLAGALKVGGNVIAITARHFGTARSWWTPVPPTYTLGAGSLVFEALIDGEWLASDRDWRCSPGTAWSPVDVPGDVACLPLESFDAREHCHRWETGSFDDDGWSRAIEIVPMHTGAHGDPSPPSEPFGMLLAPVRSRFPGGDRHPAEPTGTRYVADGDVLDDPVLQVLSDEQRQSDGSDGGAVALHSFDLGRIGAGTLALELHDAASGTILDVAAAEHLDDRGRLVTLGQHAGLRYISDGTGSERFETFDVIGARHLHASVRVPPGSDATASRDLDQRPPPASTGRSRVRMLRPPAQPDLRRRPAHRRPVCPRCLRGLPHAGTAGVDRGLGGAPDGGPGHQPRLVDGHLAPTAGSRAQGRRDVGHGPGIGLRRR